MPLDNYHNVDHIHAHVMSWTMVDSQGVITRSMTLVKENMINISGISGVFSIVGKINVVRLGVDSPQLKFICNIL